MGPDVDGLVGHLEAAEDAVQRRALRVPVPRDDAILPEHLGGGEGGRRRREGEEEGASVQPVSEEQSDRILKTFNILA